MSSTMNSAPSTNPSPTFSLGNVMGNPKSTWTGAAAVLAVVSTSMSQGLPMTSAGWVSFGVSVLMGVASIFSKA